MKIINHDLACTSYQIDAIAIKQKQNTFLMPLVQYIE